MYTFVKTFHTNISHFNLNNGGIFNKKLCFKTWKTATTTTTTTTKNMKTWFSMQKINKNYIKPAHLFSKHTSTQTLSHTEHYISPYVVAAYMRTIECVGVRVREERKQVRPSKSKAKKNSSL